MDLLRRFVGLSVFKSMFRSRRRNLALRIFLFLCAIYVILAIITKHVSFILIIRDLGYLTRPLWDSPGPSPQVVIPHFYAESLSKEELCPLHGWKARDSKDYQPKVIDAVIFSNELDILEVRLRELWDVVDKFLVMEADRTFTGNLKPLFLNDSLQRFNWASEKLVVVSVQDKLNGKPGSEFENEISMRRLIASKIGSLQLSIGDLVISSDVDEIPFSHTIKLLKNCKSLPRELHLVMRNYIYSFEYYVDTTNWRPHVTSYDHLFSYHHGLRGEGQTFALADAGWHCSFCFRYLSDFVFKMNSYSHHDRVTARHLLEKENIQRKICEGANIFDMYPEAYSYKEFFSCLGNIPKSLTTVGLPEVVVRDKVKFNFLLPGGCFREDYDNSRI